MVFGENYVITFVSSPSNLLTGQGRNSTTKQQRLRSAGPDFLVYMLLDAIVSVYLAILDQVDDRVEDSRARVLAFAGPRLP